MEERKKEGPLVYFHLKLMDVEKFSTVQLEPDDSSTLHGPTRSKYFAIVWEHCHLRTVFHFTENFDKSIRILSESRKIFKIIFWNVQQFSTSD